MRRSKRLSKSKSIRLVVFSDTHGSFRAVNRIFRNGSDSDVYIFLGDGEKELERVRELYPQRTILSVLGNCDMYSNAPKELVYTSPDGRKIFCTHGHEYSVGWSKQELYYKALELGADVVLFGHTHVRFHSHDNGLHMVNPGSAACPRDGLEPSYAFIDLLDNGIFVAHVDLK